MLLAVFSQFSGINVVMYYAQRIFLAAGASMSDAFSQTILVCVINMVATSIAVATVDRAGRKPLLIFGTLIQTASFALVGTMFHIHHQGIWLLVGILGFAAAFNLAMGPISWIVMSEIFPTKLRGRAMSVAVIMLWLADFVVSQTFPRLTEQIGPANTFWAYAFLNFLSVIFVVAMLPETKGKTLEEIEASWRK